MTTDISPLKLKENIGEIIKKQRVYFNSGKTKPLKFRVKQLEALKKLIVDNERRLFEALKNDLNKSEFEAFGSEIAQIISEIDFALKNIRRWTKPKRVSTPLVSFPSRQLIYPQPYGVVYVMGAWNYPVLLSLAPVVGAIAAGNCVILKPSEIAKDTAHLLCELIEQNFEEDFLAAIFGGPETSLEILSHKLDYIFFTGSPKVGKIIMKAAAENLTPVTLELGGKSPCIVDEDANLQVAARRIVFGKLLNAGQTCVAPDFVVVHEKVKHDLLMLMRQFIAECYGPNPETSSDLCKIVNKSHFDRLSAYLQNGTVYHGGTTKEKDLYIAPTILTDISWESDVMKEEVFGPVMPILTFNDLIHLIDELNQHEKPLAAYYFGSDRKKQGYFIENLNFGGGCINDTIFHFGNPRLPVGGIGTSGMGRYHGKYSFDTFSHLKSMVSKPTFPDIKLRYPPYKNKLKWLRLLFKI